MSRLFAVIIAVLLSLPMNTWAADSNLSTQPVIATNTLDEDIVEKEPDGTENIYKQPISKRQIAKKFLAAMGGVVISSLALFFLLSLYNRIREGYVCHTKSSDDEISLETPDDLNSAIKSFLDKTDWKG